MWMKIRDSLEYIGFTFLIVGSLYYSIFRQWDWITQAAIGGGILLLAVYAVTHIQEAKEFFQSRGGRSGMTAVVSLVLVLGILVLLNFLNFRHHTRWDLTENQLFSLSDQSKRILENLDTDVRMIGFFVDPQGSRSFEDLAAQYRFASSRVNFEVVDPQEEPGQVGRYGIERDQQVVIALGDRTEIIDQASEETITNALIKLTRDEQKVIYFLFGHGERDIESSDPEGFSSVREGLEKQNYLVKSYNLAVEGRWPQDAAVIVSAGPKVDFFEPEQKLLEDFLEGGGKFLLLADPQTEFKMESFLSQYGLQLDGGVVVDVSGLGSLLGLGAAAPIVSDYGNHEITERMNVMSFFPLAQSLSMRDSSLGYETQSLLSTSENSWLEMNLDAEEAEFQEDVDRLGPLDLAAVATRQVEDVVSEDGQTDATAEGEDSDGAAPANPEGPETKPSRQSRLVVFGDSDFVSNAYFQNAPANDDLFMMAVSWLAEETDLIALGAKDPQDRRVNLTQAEQQLIFYVTVALLPLATVFLGVWVWYRRR